MRSGSATQALGLLACLVLASCTASGVSPGATSAPSQTAHLPQPAASAQIEGTWRRIAAAPISARVGSAAAWTGEELLVFGGETYPEWVQEPAGAAYDPADDAWRLLPRAPISMRHSAQSAFTGKEFLVWGGMRTPDELMSDGAAYDPKADKWRSLPDAPLSGGTGYVSAWNGAEWVIVEAGTDGTPEQDSGRAAAYDPATDTWRVLPTAPIPDGWASVAVWSGTHLIVIRLDTDGTSSGAQWSEISGRWDEVPYNAELGIDAHAFAVWTGDTVALFGGSPDVDAGTGSWVWEYDPSSRSWRQAAGAPAESRLASPVWTGRHIIFYGDGGQDSVAFDPAEDRWLALPDVRDREREFWVTVWTGREVIVWGGSNPHGGATTTDGVALQLPM